MEKTLINLLCIDFFNVIKIAKNRELLHRPNIMLCDTTCVKI